MIDPLASCTEEQVALLRKYVDLLLDINTRINLISRKDTEDVFDRHVRHSLALAIHDFPDDCTIADWGTGGGLPAIPLAIRFPNVKVFGVDSVGKKTRAVQDMAAELGLDNVKVFNGRAELWKGKVHYSVSRATARLSKLWEWHKRVRVPLEVADGCWEAGLICLKGGDLTDEIAELNRTVRGLDVRERSLADVAPGFPDKSIIHVVKS
jgi:16S rRNA (guanine527-N7)-methyltransferase